MPSDPIERVRSIIAHYPEVFDSLLEFETTKRIPKLYRKKRIDATIDENILRQFKSHAEKNNITLSKFIEQAMLRELNKNL